MPNGFAHLVLYTWPLVAFFFFRSMPLRSALIWTILAGYLILPARAGFDLPALPTVDKDFVAISSATLFCLIFGRMANEQLANRVRQVAQSPSKTQQNSTSSFVPKRGQMIFWGLIGIAVISPFITTMANGDPIVKGRAVIPGLKTYDAFSVGLTILITILPFLLGRRYLASDESQKLLLKCIALALFGYSFLALYEIRMSPQLNFDFYGFFPHSFMQHVRAGGYRPLVFLPHGLILSLLLALATAAALALWRSKPGALGSTKWLFLGFWLFCTLVLSKSLGAFILTLLFCPIILIFRARTQMIVAAMIATLVLLYPMLRSADLIPVDAIYNAAHDIDANRADSLKVRIDNEESLLEKARQKPLSGWGGWGRSRIYNELGQDITTADGYWIIIIGTSGWLGYIAHFGLLCLPLILLGLRGGRLSLSLVTSSLCIIQCVALVDLLPNASASPILWLIAGSVMGRYQTAELHTDQTSESIDSQPATDTPAERQSRSDSPKAPTLHVRVPR